MALGDLLNNRVEITVNKDTFEESLKQDIKRYLKVAKIYQSVSEIETTFVSPFPYKMYDTQLDTISCHPVLSPAIRTISKHTSVPFNSANLIKIPPSHLRIELPPICENNMARDQTYPIAIYSCSCMVIVKFLNRLKWTRRQQKGISDRMLSENSAVFIQSNILRDYSYALSFPASDKPQYVVVFRVLNEESNSDDVELCPSKPIVPLGSVESDTYNPSIYLPTPDTSSVFIPSRDELDKDDSLMDSTMDSISSLDCQSNANIASKESIKNIDIEIDKQKAILNKNACDADEHKERKNSENSSKSLESNERQTKSSKSSKFGGQHSQLKLSQETDPCPPKITIEHCSNSKTSSTNRKRKKVKPNKHDNDIKLDKAFSSCSQNASSKRSSSYHNSKPKTPPATAYDKTQDDKVCDVADIDQNINSECLLDKPSKTGNSNSNCSYESPSSEISDFSNSSSFPISGSCSSNLSLAKFDNTTSSKKLVFTSSQNKQQLSPKSDATKLGVDSRINLISLGSSYLSPGEIPKHRLNDFIDSDIERPSRQSDIGFSLDIINQSPYRTKHSNAKFSEREDFSTYSSYSYSEFRASQSSLPSIQEHSTPTEFYSICSSLPHEGCLSS